MYPSIYIVHLYKFPQNWITGKQHQSTRMKQWFSNLVHKLIIIIICIDCCITIVGCTAIVVGIRLLFLAIVFGDELSCALTADKEQTNKK